MAAALAVLWAALVATLIFRAWRQFGAYRRLELHAPAAARAMPPVAVIVPARNEAAGIAACLAGLTSGGARPIVVDDGSTDATAEIAGSWARVVAAGPLPPGWTGKCHACWRGAAFAGPADYLCFVDADVVAEPGLVGVAVAEAEARGLDFLSLEPRQELVTVWERLVIPAGLFALAFLRDFGRPSDPASGEATANGQFILVRRAAYDRVGGHRAVRDAICEDSRLAGLFKEAGYAVALLAAPDLARVRMYRGLADLWSGLRKNSTETLGGVVPALAAALLAAPLAWAAPLLPLALAAHPMPFALAALASAAIFGLHVEGAHFLGIPRLYGFLFPVGYTLAALIVADGLRHRWRGATVWKGRRYATHPR